MTLSEPQVWLLIVALALIAAAIKGIGPVVVGGRSLPPRAVGVIAALAPALLAALVVSTSLADGRRIGLGADTAGVAVAAVLLALRAPLVLSCLAAVVVTAVIRAIA